MSYKDKWKILNPIGEPGGQGTVYRVIPLKEYNSIISKLSQSIRNLSEVNVHEPIYKKSAEELYDKIIDIIKIEKPENQGALKILHGIEQARDFKNQEARILREIEAMKKITHPSLLKILDYDPNEYWFVSEYHPNNTIKDNSELFFGEALFTLKKMKPLIEGVSKLHDAGYIHRDIKPQNIFISSNNELILGDFGLVFGVDKEKTRISNDLSRVGTGEWLPRWASNYEKLENVKSNIDVYALGKTIWSMVSGKRMPFWFYDDPQYDLTVLFQENKEMKLMNELFSKCIVDKEDDCIENASILFREINSTIEKLERKIETLGFIEKIKCKICDEGYYEVLTKNRSDSIGYNLDPNGGFFIIRACDNCGHTEFFFSRNENSLPKAWEEKK